MSVSQRPRPAPPTLLPVSAAMVIGNQVAPGAPGYTLVEFMDYECPPCRSVQPGIAPLLARYKGRLRYVVRNLPLRMHRHALSAALAAEAAREQGKFEAMHDGLLTDEELSPKSISHLAETLGLDKKRFVSSQSTTARKTVDRDTQAAAALGINATPTFLLCTPDGKVFRLNSSKEIEQIVK